MRKFPTGHGETKFGVALADVPRLYRRVAESGVIAAGGLPFILAPRLWKQARLKMPGWSCGRWPMS